jgi:hypothetical protein
MGIGVLSRSLRGRGLKLTTPNSKMNERSYTSAILIRTRGVHRGRLTCLYSQLVSDISILIHPYIHMTWSCVWKPVCKLLLFLLSPRCMYISTDCISFILWTIDRFDIKTIKHKNSNHTTQKFRNVLCTQLSVWRSRNTPPPLPPRPTRYFLYYLVLYQHRLFACTALTQTGSVYYAVRVHSLKKTQISPHAPPILQN